MFFFFVHVDYKDSIKKRKKKKNQIQATLLQDQLVKTFIKDVLKMMMMIILRR